MIDRWMWQLQPPAGSLLLDFSKFISFVFLFPLGDLICRRQLLLVLISCLGQQFFVAISSVTPAMYCCEVKRTLPVRRFWCSSTLILHAQTDVQYSLQLYFWPSDERAPGAQYSSFHTSTVQIILLRTTLYSYIMLPEECDTYSLWIRRKRWQGPWCHVWNQFQKESKIKNSIPCAL